MAEIIRVEKLLRLSFNKFYLHNFDANILRLEKMNWTIYTNLTIIDGLNIRVIGQYGYVFFDNNTIKIYKL